MEWSLVQKTMEWSLVQNNNGMVFGPKNNGMVFGPKQQWNGLWSKTTKKQLNRTERSLGTVRSGCTCKGHFLETRTQNAGPVMFRQKCATVRLLSLDDFLLVLSTHRACAGTAGRA